MFENRRKNVIFAISYTIVCVAAMLLAVFFQYRSYTQNYNRAIDAIGALIQEQYPSVEPGKIVEVLNKVDISGEETADGGFLRRYGIDSRTDAALLANDRQMQRFLILDAGLVLLAAAVFWLWLYRQSRFYKQQVQETTDYLKQINRGDYRYVMSDSREGGTAILKSELYKTAITMRESAENAHKDKLLLKDALSDISHQLKTPLTSLSINLENLEDHPNLDAGTHMRVLRRARRDVANITHMVQAILKLSRLDADVVEFDTRDTLLSEIVEKAVDSVVALCDLKNIEMIVAPDSDRDAVIACDGYWQTQAVTNIVKNAIEHAERTVRIAYYHYEMYDEIIVENDGDTISAKDAQNVFKRFYRGENATADSIGIGLALAESIVKHDNGYILVDAGGDAQRVCGTRFTIRYLRAK